MAATVRWAPSADADISRYEIQFSTSSQGPWTDLVSVQHAVGGANYNAGPSATFFYVDSSGGINRWYRLRAVDAIGGSSAWSYPFQAGAQPALTPTTELNVVQMALANIGETTTVASLTSPTTKAERLAVLFYGRTRDRILRKVAPSWATRRAPLVQLTDHSRPGWPYCYLLPPDQLRVLRVGPLYRGGDGITAEVGSSRWALEADNIGTGRIICSDAAPGEAWVAYTAHITDPSLWTPDFADAVTWALSARLVTPLVVKSDTARDVIAMARQALSEAVGDDANERKGDPPPDPDFITVRSW